MSSAARRPARALRASPRRRRGRQAGGPRARPAPGSRRSRARRGAGLHRQPALVQHARRPAADARAACAAASSCRLLDLHVHQLHPHAARRCSAWDARYRNAGLTIVGVHTPEFDFEKDAGNVAAAIRQNDLRYPVAQDNELRRRGTPGATSTGRRSTSIDARGQVRYAHFGEGDDGEDRGRDPLAAGRGSGRGAGRARPPATRELRPGAPGDPGDLPRDRARRAASRPERRATAAHAYPPAPRRARGSAASRSRGTLARPTTRAPPPGPARAISVRFQAKDVYLVLSPPPGSARPVRVLLDGRPIGSAAGSDARGGTVAVTRQRLYHLVHTAPRRPPPRWSCARRAGVSGYAFTFG